MIEKQDFYHGAALVKLIDDGRITKIKKHESGYIIDDNTVVFFKYTTKDRTPWRFGFSKDEVDQLYVLAEKNRLFAALICGGDGICALDFERIDTLLKNQPGWISAKRIFNKQYEVSGSQGNLNGKISLKLWPDILYDLD